MSAHLESIRNAQADIVHLQHELHALQYLHRLFFTAGFGIRRLHQQAQRSSRNRKILRRDFVR